MADVMTEHAALGILPPLRRGKSFTLPGKRRLFRVCKSLASTASGSGPPSIQVGRLIHSSGA
jgi:hypothetical protein